MKKSPSSVIFVALTVVAVAAISAAAYAAVITVCSRGCDFTTIQQAVDNANHGDTLELGPERFYENVVVGKNLTIRGEGPDRTVVDGSASGSVFRNVQPWTDHLTLEDMTIQNAAPVTRCCPYQYDEGHGVAYFSQLDLRNCVVRNNHGGDIDHGWVWGSGVAADRLRLEDCVVRNNHSRGPFSSGAIFAFTEAVITTTLITGNTAVGGSCDEWRWCPSTGAAIYMVGGDSINSRGRLELRSSRILNNTSENGAIASYWGLDELTIDKTTISGNSIGGIGLWADTGVITDSTISDNEGGWGGAVLGGDITIKNTTVAGNTSDGAEGRGGLLLTRGSAAIVHSTIVDNTPSGLQLGSHQWPASATISNTIVANNSDSDCDGEVGNIVSEGHNLSSDSSCLFTAAGDLENTDPLLHRLHDNGGPTPTCALHPHSPAIDAGGGTCEPADQRGMRRPWDGDGDGLATCDIGAYEYGSTTFALRAILPLHDLIITLSGYDYDLVAPLQEAIQILEDGDPSNDGEAVGSLLAFIAEVEEQRGWTLTDAEADELIAEAQRIIGLLNFGGSPIGNS